MSDKIKYKNGESGEHHEDCMCGKCSENSKTKKMESTLETLAAAVTALTAKLTALESKAISPTALTFTKTDGATVQLSAQEIATAIGQIETFKKTAGDAEKNALITKLSTECRVIFDPANPGVAMKLEDIQKMELPMLKFAAANSQVLPTQARAIYRGDKPADNKPDPTKVHGDALIQASFEAQGYDNLDKMMAKLSGN